MEREVRSLILNSSMVAGRCTSPLLLFRTAWSLFSEPVVTSRLEKGSDAMSVFGEVKSTPRTSKNASVEWSLGDSTVPNDECNASATTCFDRSMHGWRVVFRARGHGGHA